MNRCVKLSLLVVLALAAVPAWALQLGQIQVKSALDQPLVAVIPVTPDFPGEATHLKVALASDAAFARAGISRSALGEPLQFHVATDSHGQPIIRVTSKQPVREPYLDFLVQVSWSRGKLLREYTVLLDPIGLHESASSATAAPAPQRHAAPASKPRAAVQTASKTAAPAAGGGVYGPVAYGDTLSHIARAHGISGVSYQQMLLALKAANPDAFFNNNINDLKTGAVLHIPTRTQALALSRSAAVAAVRAQNHAWTSARAPQHPTLVAGAGGAATTSSAATTAGLNDHLTLVPPGHAKGATGTGGAQANAGDLRNQLARSKEELVSQQQQSADLQSRVSALENLATQNKQLLALKNDEIAALQQKLTQARKAQGLPALAASALAAPAGTAVAAGSAAVPAGAATAAVATASVGATPAVAGTAAAATAAALAAQPEPATKPTPAQQPVVAHKSAPPHAQPARHNAAAMTPWYAQWRTRIAIIIIILLLIAWALWRRHKAHKLRYAPVAPTGDEPAAEPGVGLAAEEGGDEATTLLAELAEHPDDADLHLRLTTLYYERGDVDNFEAAAEAMQADLDDPTSTPQWQEVLKMGHELDPAYPLFVSTAEVDDGWSAPASELEPEYPGAEPAAEGVGEEPRVGLSDDVEDDAPAFVAPELTADEADDAITRHHLGDAGIELTDEPPVDVPPLETFGQDMDEPAPVPAVDEPADMAPLEFETIPAPPVEAEPEENVTPEPAAELPEYTSARDGDDEALTSGQDIDPEGLAGNPVDIKLDLARAYIDMGDHEGARAMLQEAMTEGSQVQRDAARKLLDELA